MDGTTATIGTTGVLVYLAIIVLMIAGMWKVFVKAGQPGWASIVPLYNIYVLLQIAGKPGWWLLLMLIPFVNFVVFFLFNIEIAKRFGKSTGYGIGLTLLGFIFYPMLGFSDATYKAA